MIDYSKREDAIEQARRNWIGEGEWIASTKIQPLKILTTADVRENVKGKWKIEYTGDGWGDYIDVTCTNCGKTITHGELYNFCPNCGAQMER